MSDQTAVWLILAGAVTVAGLLLWLRDRFRDLRHIPEAERKLDEKKNAEGARAFISLFYAVGCLVRGIEIQALLARIFLFAGSLLFAWISFQSWRRIKALGIRVRSSKHLANHEGGAM